MTCTTETEGPLLSVHVYVYYVKCSTRPTLPVGAEGDNAPNILHDVVTLCSIQSTCSPLDDFFFFFLSFPSARTCTRQFGKCRFLIACVSSARILIVRDRENSRGQKSKMIYVRYQTRQSRAKKI